MEADDWIVGVKTANGEDVIKGPGSFGGMSPSEIETVYFPVSLFWTDQADLLEADLLEVAREERSSGVEITYSAKLEDSTPNDDLWYVQLDLWEYPSNVVNHTELQHSENITPAMWDEEDLLDAIR